MRGHTLLELTVVLALLGAAGAALLPAARRQADRAAVTGAREAVAALVARTRAEAMALGGASLHLRESDAVAWIQAGDSLVTTLGLGDEFGVTLELGGTGDEAELAFDAMGLGRRASRSVRLLRDEAETRLVIAAYGRAVRS